MKIPILFIFFVYFEGAVGGCCNAGYWCDGDPSFVKQPRVSQAFDRTSTVMISWDTTFLHMAKCADYFIVRYAPINGRGHPTKKFAIAPVELVRKEKMDEWKDVKNPSVTKYLATFEAKENTDYIIKVIARDKGLGWGEHEGQAWVEAKPITFHVRPFWHPFNSKISRKVHGRHLRNMNHNNVHIKKFRNNRREIF